MAKQVLMGAASDRLEALVRTSELRHTGQIRVCVEGALPLSYLRRDASATERARALFAKLKVWDTEDNNGVLIYLLAPERAIEIVVDRGLLRHVAPAVWTQVINDMQAAFRTGEFEAGLTQAIGVADEQLRAYFPRSPEGGVTPGTSSDNLPDRPVLL